ncbi:MAG: Rne/Rng family ribonuclease [Holophagaceae bacterium]
MGKKIMMINATDPEEIRVATLVDGVLTDFDIEFMHNEKIKGNIYKARVVRVDQALQAAFIHYGGQKNGFLPLGELPRDMVSPDGRRGRIQDLLQRDQEIMVQAVREELGSKGAMMTGQLSLPGRYLVLTPGNPVNGISRKIESREEREYFKQLIDEMDIPKNFGVIVRTASMGVTKEDFQRDLDYLMDTWKEVLARYKHRHGPGLVWQEDDVVTRTLRDGFTADVEEVTIDDLDTFHQAQHFFKRTMPQHLGVLKHHVGKKPLFTKYQTDEQIDRIYARKVNLPSGGALVLDQTEALVAIDVNSGKTSGENQEDTAYKTNMEAAEEVARQLRMRDLAGLIAIDFIDMKKDSHIKAVQDKLVDCLKDDKARMEVGKINRFGVLVMTRQRIRPSIHHVTHETCPTCQGTGKVKNLEAMVLSVARRIKSMLSREGIREIEVKLAPAIAMAVLNQKRRELAEMEEQSGASVVILADPAVGYGEMVAAIEKAEEEAPEAAPRREHRKAGDPDEDTVVLGGDSPISFEKALGEEPRKSAATKEGAKDKDGFKFDRRDLQRAALEERERLRALFESAKPGEGAEDEDAVPSGEETAEGAGKGRSRRRGRGRGRGEAPRPEPAAVAGGETDAPAAEPVKPGGKGAGRKEAKAPKPAVAPQSTAIAILAALGPVSPEAPRAPEPGPSPEPPRLSADVVASLLTPSPRPKRPGGAAAEPTASPEAGAPAAAAGLEAKPARRAKAEAGAESKPKRESRPKAEPKPKPKAEPKAKAKAEPKAKAESKPKAERKAKAEAKAKGEAATVPQAGMKPER